MGQILSLLKILFRPELGTEEELQVARQFFPAAVTSRNSPSLKNSIVIGRYSVLPYYKELEHDLRLRSAKLINSHKMHTWVADAREWADVLGPNLTPSALDATDFYRLPEGAYIVKGITNSRKHKWHTHMFAPTRADLARVVSRLNDDPFISDQGLIVRPYVPLKSFGDGINGIPISHEWRTFWWKGQFVSGGWYWSNHPEHKPAGEIPEAALHCAQLAANIAKDYINFFVVDVAETAEGNWIVIELNDGQMSGLSDIEPYDFYAKLRAVAWVDQCLQYPDDTIDELFELVDENLLRGEFKLVNAFFGVHPAIWGSYLATSLLTVTNVVRETSAFKGKRDAFILEAQKIYASCRGF